MLTVPCSIFVKIIEPLAGKYVFWSVLYSTPGIVFIVKKSRPTEVISAEEGIPTVVSVSGSLLSLGIVVVVSFTRVTML